MAGLHPRWQVRHVLVVEDKFCREPGLRIYEREESRCLLDIHPADLRSNPHKPQLCKRASHKESELPGLHPRRSAAMKRVLANAKSKQHIHIQQIRSRLAHGKFAMISAAISLVSTGAFGPKSKTGKPVSGSAIILPLNCTCSGAAITIRSPSSVACTGSPGRMPRTAQSVSGINTSPLSGARICVADCRHKEMKPERQAGKWLVLTANPHRGAGSAESASAYASTVITAAFSANSRGFTLSNVSAGV